MSSLTAQVSSSPQQTGELSGIKGSGDEHSGSLAGADGFRLGYRPSLDGIRGLAMLGVMVFHSSLNFIPGGVLNMTVFFVLSGFLITALLMQEWNRNGSISLKQFYYRRALRLFPALLVFLLVCCLYALTQPKDDAIVTYKSVAATLLYVANWVNAYSPQDLGPLSHTWSLSVEEQFYMFLPLFLSTMLWLKIKRISIVVFLLLGITASVVQTITLWEGEHSIRRIYFGTDTRLDELLIGCLIGILASWNILPKTYRAILASKIAALVSVICIIFWQLTLDEHHPFMSWGATTLVAAASASIIVNLISSPVKFLAFILELKIIVWVGRISYGLYLWHFPIFRQINEINLHPILILIVEFAITFVVAALSYRFIEQPFLRLKNRSGAAARAATVPAP